LILENVEADGSVGVDVGVVNFGDEVAFGRSEWVISGEVNVKEEDSSSIGAIIRTDDGGLPMELVVLSGSS